MRRILLGTLLVVACHRDAEPSRANVPASGAASQPSATAPPPTTSAATRPSPAGSTMTVTLGAPAHFKSGGRGVAGDVTFTVRMLPKLIVSGAPHEIEQLQIECVRGAEHGTIQVDTQKRRAEWGGVVFELGYADVYHDDIELTVQRK